MSFFSGRHGSLVYLGKPVAKVSSWQLTLSTDLLETTTVEQFAPTYRPGMKSATGSAQLFYYRLEFRDRTENTSFVELLNKLVRVGELGEADRVSLDLGIGSSTADRLLVDAYLTRADLGSTSGEVAKVSVDFTVTGDLKRGLG
jgi:hypothetical protein